MSSRYHGWRVALCKLGTDKTRSYYSHSHNLRKSSRTIIIIRFVDKGGSLISYLENTIKRSQHGCAANFCGKADGENSVEKWPRLLKFAPAVQRLGLALVLVGVSGAEALAGDSGLQWSSHTFDNGNRLVVAYHLKIEHRAKSPLDILVHQLGTAEGKKLIADAAAALGLNPALATIVTNVAPLPKFAFEETENKGNFLSPTGYTICKAGPVGKIEASRASWSTKILRNANVDGLNYYTAVGTGKGDTHRVEGTFFVEYVEPTAGWEVKYGCSADGAVVWDKKG